MKKDIAGCRHGLRTNNGGVEPGQFNERHVVCLAMGAGIHTFGLGIGDEWRSIRLQGRLSEELPTLQDPKGRTRRH